MVIDMKEKIFTKENKKTLDIFKVKCYFIVRPNVSTPLKRVLTTEKEVK